MKKLFPILILAFIAACKNTTTTTETTTFDSTSTVVTAVDTKHELYVLDSVLKHFETPMQRFKAPIGHVVKFTGAKGTVLTVDGQDLETVSGKPMGNHIDIELKELTTTEELARERAATVSDGKLLVSGGAYYINMTSGGEQLKLKQGKRLKVQFPKLAKERMSLFSGQRDSLGQMNWKQISDKVTAGNGDMKDQQEGMSDKDIDAIHAYADSEKETPEGKAAKKERSLVAEEVALQQLGWINCDHFLDYGDLTDIAINTDRQDSMNYVSAYVIFSDINSVLQFYFNAAQQGTIPNVPVGSKVSIVVIGLRNGKLYTYKVPQTVSAGQKITVKLKETTEKDIATLFKVK